MNIMRRRETSDDYRTFTIEEDGIYEAPNGSRFQFRKGYVLGADGKHYTRVADFPEPPPSMDFWTEVRSRLRDIPAIP